MRFGTDSKSICSRALGFGSMGPRWVFTRRFQHAQTAASPTSRMHFGTDSKCICSRAPGSGSIGPTLGFYESKRFCSPHSGLGAWGHVGPLHGDLGTHTPLRHNLYEYTSARILRVWEHGATLGFYTTVSARTNRCVTNLTNAFRHGF